MRTLGERFGLGRQIDFPEKQRHSSKLEVGLVLFAILCIIAAVVISKATDWGAENRPTGSILPWLGF
jgi:hypothetical protein